MKNNNSQLKNIKSIKTRIYLTKEQEVYFNKAFGIRRWCYNWGLEKIIESWKNNLDENNKKIYLTNYNLAKMLNSIKDEQYPWLNEVNGMIRQEAFRDLNESVNRYFKKIKEVKNKSQDYKPNKFKPKFISKKHLKDTFRYHIKDRSYALPINPISDHYFKMMTVNGTRGNDTRFKIKCKESLLFLNDTSKYRVCEYTFTRKCNKYYLSISYERTNQRKLKLPEKTSCIGIDMGLKHALTCYDGSEAWTFDIPDSLKNKYEKRTERKNRQLSKKYENIKKYNKTVSEDKQVNYENSKYFQKLKLQLQKCYEKENNVKKDWRENYTSWLVQNYHTIKIEEYGFTLNKNNNRSRVMARVGGWLFIKRLTQKSLEYNSNLIIIPKFTPTTQTCSCCGHRFEGEDKLTLSDRIYKCPNCNSKIDRDINAAKNIFYYQTSESKLPVTSKK